MSATSVPEREKPQVLHAPEKEIDALESPLPPLQAPEKEIDALDCPAPDPCAAPEKEIDALDRT